MLSQNSLKKIDDLLAKSLVSAQSADGLKQLEYAKQANVLAQQAKNSERIAKSYVQMSTALLMLGLHKESLLYLQKAQEEEYVKKDPLLQAQVAEFKGFNYGELNLQSQNIRERYNVLKFLKNRNDEESTAFRIGTYTNVAFFYSENKKNLDSAFHYFKLEEQELKKMPEAKYFYFKTDYYLFLGDTYLKAGKADSALVNLDKSYALAKKYNHPAIYMQYGLFGDYYKAQKEYPKALENYQKSVELMKKGFVRTADLVDVYNKIAGLYGIQGNKEKQKEYTNLAMKLQNELLIKHNKDVDYALNVILKDKSDENSLAQTKNIVWIVVGVLLLILLFFFVYKVLTKKLKQKENLITEANTDLQNKEEIISQKHTETEELQLKVGDAYNEVIELAKKNDPAFYFRFQEVYPEFQKKVLDLNPDLRTSELTLCAYVFLGFSIKDIAEYTFKSVNTIRNRKQSLRKKFAISTEEDLGVWLQKLIEN